MRRYPVQNLRNLALIAHAGAGKTSLAEAMLFTAGATDRLGRVDDGNTMTDHEPEETRRKVSISLGIAPLEWQGHKITLLDTPGYFDFVGDVASALRAADAAILVVDAVGGVEVGTEITYRRAKEAGLARAIVVNKLDRENASFTKTVAALEEAFGRAVLPFHLPLGVQSEFKGLVDITAEKAYQFGARDVAEIPVPADLAYAIAGYRDRLMELAAEADDELTIKFLEEGTLSPVELALGLKKGIARGDIVPVFVAAAVKNAGTACLLNAIVEYLPSPLDARDVLASDTDEEPVTVRPSESEPFRALVFKTTADQFVGRMTLMRIYSGNIRADQLVYNATRGRTEKLANLFIPKGKGQEPVTEAGPGDIIAVAKLSVTQTNDTLCADEASAVHLAPIYFPPPVYSVAVQPKAKGDEDKIGSSLARLAEEDQTFTVRRDTTTAETVISGLGEMHLDVMLERLKRKFGVESVTTVPTIAYRETIRGKAVAEYKHKKQSGGRGQYGHCKIELEPLAEGHYEFVDRIFAGAVPLNYRPAVDKGVQEAMADGVLASCPVQGVRCTLLDGSYHDVDSSEMAFKIAARNAFRQAFMNAKPVLLEPIMRVKISIPDSYTGDIMGDMNKRRGRIMGMDPAEDGAQVIQAIVPQAEMHRYAIDLRSMTQGRGSFVAEFAHYEEVPAPVAKPLIEAAVAMRKAENE